MEYELAKELKDAGYKMDYNLDGFSDFDKRTADIALDLSELIEACLDLIPDKFLDITSRDYRPEQWVATSSWKITSGNTPEEAVARLWLALNKK